MFKFDLIPNKEKVTTLFLLESPHTDELKYGYPCAGYSGRKMSRRIFGKKSWPFGKILKSGNKRAEEFGIFNSCQFPLGKKKSLNSEEIKVSIVKDIKLSKNRHDNYDKLAKCLTSLPNLEEITFYKQRFLSILENSPSINTLVVCGFIAQAFFKHFLDETDFNYNRPTRFLTANGRVFTILFVNHPGEHEKSWIFDLKNANLYK